MGEKTGFLTVLLIFGIGIIPLLLSTFQDHVTSSKLLTLSTEMQQLVSSEGGVTDKVNNVVSEFENRGVNISFADKNGNTISGKVPVGQEVFMTYEFRDFETSNSTIILRR